MRPSSPQNVEERKIRNEGNDGEGDSERCCTAHETSHQYGGKDERMRTHARHLIMADL